MEACDVLVIGGSVAGAALAIHLGRRGLRTLLVDKARFPRLKACGEGLLPHGAEELRKLGLGDPPGTRVTGIRYFSPSGDSATGRFDEAGLGPGFVVRRFDFDRWLLDHARAAPGVRVLESTDASGLSLDARGAEAAGVRAKIVVGADGFRSIFHRRRPFRRTHPRRQRTGLCTVVRGYPAADTVDVFLGRGGEAYAGPSGPGETSLALLLEQKTDPRAFLAGIPALRNVEIARRFIGASPLGSRVTPIVHGRALLIGDAAGAVDPISGEGMALALLSARVAAEAIQEAIETGDPARLERYAVERRRLMASAARLSDLILAVTRYPWAADRVVRKLSRDARLFGRLLRSACGADSIGWKDKAALIL